MHLKRSILIQFLPALLALYIVALLVFVANWGVVESSEARYAEIAREMFISGDWLHPRLLNIFHFHKPPLTYWLTAMGYSIFGINTLGVRFFLMVSFVLQLFLLYRIAELLFKDKNHAFISTWIYSTMLLVLVSIRGLTTDAYLNTFILLTILSFLKWRTDQKTYWLYIMAIALGLGFLTKGPLILILPGLFFIGFRKHLPAAPLGYHHVISFFLFILVGLSWYAYLVFENQLFLTYFLFRQTYERMTNAEVFSRHEPFWYYLVYTPAVTLPWTIILVNGFVKSKWKGISPLLRKVTLFLILIPLLFFSMVSSKLILYVLPVFPAISMLTAYFLLQIKKESPIENSFLFFFLFVCVAVWCIPLFDKSIHFPIELWVLPALAGILFVVIRKFRKLDFTERMLLTTLTFSIFIICYGARFMKYNELKVNSMRPLAEWIKSEGLQEKEIMVYDQLLPSLAFNLNRSIISLHDGNRNLKREVNFEANDDWKESLFDLTQPSEANRLLPKLEKTPLLIVKGQLKPSAQWMEKYFKHEHHDGKWTIYY